MFGDADVPNSTNVSIKYQVFITLALKFGYAKSHNRANYWINVSRLAHRTGFSDIAVTKACLELKADNVVDFNEHTREARLFFENTYLGEVM